MIEPIVVKLSAETLNQMTADKIIYAEYAPPGAMGNAGGALFYTITDGSFICYEADLDTDENVYARVVDFLRFNESTTTGGILRFYNGGAGNYVFINKNVSLKIAGSYFIYAPDDKESAIYSSVPGVFNSVVYALKRQAGFETARRLEAARDEARKHIDKEITGGKIYTEKEITAILNAYCVSQDAVSLRRSLIDEGFLRRTNDGKAYWRNAEK